MRPVPTNPMTSVIVKVIEQNREASLSIVDAEVAEIMRRAFDSSKPEKK